MYEDSFRKRYGTAPVAVSCIDGMIITKPHFHNDVEMLYVITGTSKVQVSNQTFTAKAGDLIFVNPWEVHTIVPDASAPYRHHCICFDPSLIADKRISEDLQKGHLAFCRHFSEEPEQKHLCELFDKLYDSVSHNGKALLFDATAYVSMIFSTLVSGSYLLHKPEGDKQTTFCTSVIRYISDHYSEPITSREVAQELYFTQNYFCRKFKGIFGLPFSEYLNMYRLLKAKAQLGAKSGKIADVAAACGFNDVIYFTKSFKKFFGITPAKYQKDNTEQKQ